MKEDEDDFECGAHAAAAPLVHPSPNAPLEDHEHEEERAHDDDAYAESRGRCAEAGHTVERHRLEVVLLHVVRVTEGEAQ